MRRTPLVTGIVALLLVGGGCGGTDKKDEPIGPVGDAAESPSATPEAGSSAGSAGGSTTTFDDRGNDILRGTVKGATTPEAKAVVDAWFKYWEVRVASFGQVKVDPRLGSVAAADALAQVVQYVAYLRSKKLHTVGDTKLGVTDLKVTGRSATLASCGANKSTDRKADGTPAEALTPFFTVTGGLSEVGGQWRVIEMKVVGKQACSA